MAEIPKYDPISDTHFDLDSYLESQELIQDTILSDSLKSEYYEVTDIIKNNIQHQPTYDYKYHALHLNIQSLPAKLEKLNNLITNLDNNKLSIDFILLCETFLNSTNHNLQHISGYNFVSKHRKSKARGGVGIYIKDKYNFKVREDLSIFIEGEFESIFVEVELGAEKALIGEIYRIPNSNISNSMVQYEYLIDEIANYKNPVIIGTDQNLDLLHIDHHTVTQQYLNLFLSNRLIPTIHKPTRITHSSATLIDNLYVNMTNCNSIASGIILTDISDHLPIFTFIGRQTHNKKDKKMQVSYRKIDDNAITLIKEELNRVSWEFIDNLPVEEAYNAFSSKLQTIINSCAPQKTVNLRSKKIKHNPWMTKGLIKSCLKLNKLYIKKLKCPKEHPYTKKYIKYRNIYNKVKRLAKKLYYAHILQTHKNNMKKTWGVINSLIGKQHDKSNIIQSFKINNTLQTDPDIISNSFCKYFTNVGPNLANKIPNSDYDATHFVTKKITQNMFMVPTDPNEVSQIINQLNNKTSCGHDGISLSLIKKINEPLTYPVTKLINKSLQEAFVPEALKVAKVIPIYKTKDKQLLQNYRPISVLPSMSKILEKIVFKRLYGFLDNNSFFHDSQYGFRPKHSTIDAITEFTQNIYRSLESNRYSIGIFLDLSKAFDTINIDILIQKLDLSGVRGKALDWFRSYLYNRSQYVNFNGHKSDYTVITHGVPQGSILGPLLFLIYINDLPNALKYCKPVIFADDTNLFATSTKLNSLISNVNTDLIMLSEWFKTNKLSVNIDKTFYIIFHKRSQNIPPNLIIKLDKKTIAKKESTVFLGMVINSSLNWHEHIEKVANKLKTGNYIINRLKHFLPRDSLKLLYYTLIHPHLSYGIIHWGKAQQSKLNKLVILQKKIIRALNKCEYNAHTNNLFHNMNILKLNEIYDLQVATFMYKYINLLLPHPLKDLFVLNKQLHTYNTRNRNNPIVPMHRTESGKKCIAHMGPVIWIKVPDNIKKAKTLKSFRSLLKKNLLKRYCLHS